MLTLHRLKMYLDERGRLVFPRDILREVYEDLTKGECLLVTHTMEAYLIDGNLYAVTLEDEQIKEIYMTPNNLFNSLSLNERYNLIKRLTRSTSISDNYLTGVAKEVYENNGQQYTVVFENNQIKEINEKSV